MSNTRLHRSWHDILMEMRTLSSRAFSRAAGAPLVEGNYIRLLKDAGENYPAWLEAISAAKEKIYFESYIIHKDSAGQMFADALIAKAKQGVRVRLIYDWFGNLGNNSKTFWNILRARGVEVRCYNPPRFDSPLGWLSRDHRKTLVVDGKIGFISGLCVGRMWEGLPEKKIPPWRDTGVEVRGPAVIDIEKAFAQIWAMTGEPIDEQELSIKNDSSDAGSVALRVVASVPVTSGLFRVDQLVAAIAKNRLWLTDAYFAGTNAFLQSLKAAAIDGVDVRLLVPNATDLPVLKPLSRAGYRTLLEAGVRIFEWNGPMLHAKTAVADSSWARVGSTNLNFASWFGNCELDVIIENKNFALEMEEMYLQDLTNSTEIVLDARQKVRSLGQPQRRFRIRQKRRGSMGRAAAGAIRIGHTVGAAFTGRRVLEPIEARLMAAAGLLLFVLAIFFALFPRVVAYIILFILLWLGVTLLYRSFKLHRQGKHGKNLP